MASMIPVRAVEPPIGALTMLTMRLLNAPYVMISLGISFPRTTGSYLVSCRRFTRLEYSSSAVAPGFANGQKSGASRHAWRKSWTVLSAWVTPSAFL